MLLPKLGGLWLLPPWDFPHQMRVTLWITTAIHLDTPRVKIRPHLQRPHLRKKMQAMLNRLGDAYTISALANAERRSPGMLENSGLDDQLVRRALRKAKFLRRKLSRDF